MSSAVASRRGRAGEPDLNASSPEVDKQSRRFADAADAPPQTAQFRQPGAVLADRSGACDISLTSCELEDWRQCDRFPVLARLMAIRMRSFRRTSPTLGMVATNC